MVVEINGKGVNAAFKRKFSWKKSGPVKRRTNTVSDVDKK